VGGKEHTRNRRPTREMGFVPRCSSVCSSISLTTTTFIYQGTEGTRGTTSIPPVVVVVLDLDFPKSKRGERGGIFY
jgi:hypothetical protein